MKVNYLTTNTLKFSIAKRYFDAVDDCELVQHSFDVPEVQDESCEEIARQAAVFAAKTLGEPCIKLDVGFYIHSLGGFPGPFVKYINDWLSEEDILAMLDKKTDRSAHFTDVAAVGFPDGSSKTFSLEHQGKIAQSGEYTPSSWPANSLFIPDGYDRPLGSLSETDQEGHWGDGTWPLVVEYLKSI